MRVLVLSADDPSSILGVRTLAHGAASFESAAALRATR